MGACDSAVFASVTERVLEIRNQPVNTCITSRGIALRSGEFWGKCHAKSNVFVRKKNPMIRGEPEREQI